MATLIARADGNWTDASTWGVVDATSILLNEATREDELATGSYRASSGFTPGAIEVDGVALYVSRRNASVSGTITVQLWNDTDSAEAAVVTINSSDIPYRPSSYQTTYLGGWYLFKFAATTLIAAKSYKVRIQRSTDDGVAFACDSTQYNWSRMLRTTTTAAPAAGDNTIIAKEMTAAATATNRTVTLNETATTDYGFVRVCSGGTLALATSAATAYQLKISGDLIVYGDGILQLGSTGTPLPADSTFALTLDCGSNGQYGVIFKGGQFICQETLRTYYYCKLAADAAVNATSLTTSVSTGWRDNDEIVIASTTRTSGQCESGTLNGAASGTTLTVDGFGGAGGGLANAHAGANGIEAEIIMRTRNIKIHGASVNAVGYMFFYESAVADIDGLELYWMGSDNNYKSSFMILTRNDGAYVGAIDAKYVSIHTAWNTSTYGFHARGANCGNWQLRYCVVAYTYLEAVRVGDACSGSTAWSVKDCVFIRAGSGGSGASFADIGGTFEDVTIAGAYDKGLLLTEASGDIGTFKNITIHSCGSNGLYLNQRLGRGGSYGTLFEGLKIWRCSSYGIYFDATLRDIKFLSCELFGNYDFQVLLKSGFGFVFDTCTISADSSFGGTADIGFAADTVSIRVDNCKLGVVEGIKVASTENFRTHNNVTYHLEIRSNNTDLSAGTIFSSNFWANLDLTSFGGFTKYDKISGDTRRYQYAGTARSDTAIYKTASPSERLTPNYAATKFASGPKRFQVASGGNATVSVWVRKSASGDAGGADYNGSEPRLIVRANSAAGISADTVLDTVSVAVGNWEQLTGACGVVSEDCVLEVYVDCDGSAGWVNVDDWTLSIA